MTGWKAVSSDEEEIARTLVKVGPLSVAINAALLQFYWGGIFDPYDYFCDPEALDHAVLLVGFGSEASQEFWTVKNSWGAAWGKGLASGPMQADTRISHWPSLMPGLHEFQCRGGGLFPHRAGGWKMRHKHGSDFRLRRPQNTTRC